MQASVAPPPPPEAPPVSTDIQTVQLDGNIKLFQCFCNSHLRYEAEYGRKRGTTTNSYMVTDGNEAMLIDVPRKAYLETFCTLADMSFLSVSRSLSFAAVWSMLPSASLLTHFRLNVKTNLPSPLGSMQAIRYPRRKPSYLSWSSLI